MSVSDLTPLECPACGHAHELRVFHSVNGDRRPDLRQAILDGDFQAQVCEACENRFRVEPSLSYFDQGLGLWIRALSLDRVEDWGELELECRLLHLQTFGPIAPPIVQEIGLGLQARLVFGWAALREKLLCATHGLDDATLEVAKLAVLSSLPASNLGDGCEWRLQEVTEEHLILGVLVGAGEYPLEQIEVPRSLLDDIERDAQAWASTREELVGEGLFVDLNRVLIQPAAEDAA